MSKVDFIVDSAASFMPEWYQKQGIHVIQLGLKFPSEEPVLEFDIPPRRFYTRLESCKSLPTTNAATPEEVMSAYDSALETGAPHVIALTMMKEKSTTFNTARMVAKEPRYGGKVTVIDTHTIGPAEGFIAVEAKRLSESFPLEEVINRIETLTHNSKFYLVPKTLEFLYRGGRVSDIEYFVGSILKTIPVISDVKNRTDGSYDVLGVLKSRTMPRAVDSMLERLAKDAAAAKGRGLDTAYLTVVHGNNEESAKTVSVNALERLTAAGLNVKLHPSEKAPFGFVTPVIGTHTGPGAVGVSVLYCKS